MDMALDDIIATKPKTGRGGRGAPRGARRGSAREQVLGKAPASPTTRARMSTTPTTNASSPAAGNKIMISNLPYDVNEAQIKELFTQTIGPIREVIITYDSNGKSKGIASVTFNKASDSQKAYQQYNNRLIDGKRAMKIEMVVDLARANQPASLATRVAAAPAADGNAGRTRGTATRGRGRGRGGARTSNTRAPKSAADLDAEMEDYATSNSNGAAPAPEAAAAA